MGYLGLPQCSYRSERLARWQHREGLQFSSQSLGSLECVYGIWGVTDRQQLGREAHDANRDWPQELVVYREPTRGDPQYELEVVGSNCVADEA